jgi:hypothetical protein
MAPVGKRGGKSQPGRALSMNRAGKVGEKHRKIKLASRFTKVEG